MDSLGEQDGITHDKWNENREAHVPFAFTGRKSVSFPIGKTLRACKFVITNITPMRVSVKMAKCLIEKLPKLG